MDFFGKSIWSVVISAAATVLCAVVEAALDEE